MKLTSKQLRKIIRETIEATPVNEGAGDPVQMLSDSMSALEQLARAQTGTVHQELWAIIRGMGQALDMLEQQSFDSY
jgi:hypothetical protein